MSSHRRGGGVARPGAATTFVESVAISSATSDGPTGADGAAAARPEKSRIL